MANSGAPASQSSRAALTLLALGVVFGDIGTSPLYAVKETFSPGHGIPLDTENILGGLSVIFWSLMRGKVLEHVMIVHRLENLGGARQKHMADIFGPVTGQIDPLYRLGDCHQHLSLTFCPAQFLGGDAAGFTVCFFDRGIAHPVCGCLLYTSPSPRD